MPLYPHLLSATTRAALEQMGKDHNMTGTTPDDDMDVIAALMIASNARRVLQFGTFIGGSALVMADIARRNGQADSSLVTVDPNPGYNELCRKYAALAGLQDTLHTVDGYSTDAALIDKLGESEWDVIFLDTTHQFFATRDEIAYIAPICRPHTLFLFHDASTFAADTLDTQKQGGVKRAMREWCIQRPNWQWFVFEKPAFGQYGIGLMQRKVVQ